METLGVVVVESGLHRLDVLKLILHRVDVLLFENLGVDGSLVCVGGINVPCAEHDVVEICDGDNLVIFEVFFVFAFSDTDFVVLGH